MSYPDNNPKTAFGAKKCPLDLVPPIAVAALAEALGNGAEKYGPYNWREHQISSSVYYAAALRHLMAWWDGEDVAPDSGVHHLAHAMACMALVLDAQGIDMLNDNRPTPGGMPERLAPKNESEGNYAAYCASCGRGMDEGQKACDSDDCPGNEGYWYVATPYTSHPEGQTVAYQHANEAAARLHCEEWLPVFSPIAHSHSLCKIYGTERGIEDHLDAQFWQRFDRPLLDAAYGLAVVMMPGFDVSYGINHEVNEARRQGKPIRYYNWPELMDITDRVEKLANMGSVSFSFAPKEEAA